MIQKIKLKNFKCFLDFEIDNLSPITIISGRNNVGKTALLEAILIQNILKIQDYFYFLLTLHNEFPTNNISPQKIWDLFFYNKDNSDTFIIRYDRADYYANKENINTLSTRLSVTKLYDNLLNYDFNSISQSYKSTTLQQIVHIDHIIKNYNFSGKYYIENDILKFYTDKKYTSERKFFPALPYENILLYKNSSSISSIPKWLSKTILDHKKKVLLLDILKLFDSNITSISPVIDSGRASVYITTKENNGTEKHIPINYMGNGLNKAFQLLLTILNLPYGILLIDEIENGLYYELYEEILTYIFKIALQIKCQIIMTTHSRDIVEAAFNSMKKLECTNMLCYQRIDITKNMEKKHISFKEMISKFLSTLILKLGNCYNLYKY